MGRPLQEAAAMDNQSLHFPQLYLAAGAVPPIIPAGLMPAGGTLRLPTSQNLQASLRALMEEDPVRPEPSQPVPVAYCMAMAPVAACGTMPTTTMPQLSADAVRIANAFHRQHQQLQPPQHEQHALIQPQPYAAEQPHPGPAGMHCNALGSHGCMSAALAPAGWAPTQLEANPHPNPHPNTAPAWAAQGQGNGSDGAGLLATWQVHARDDAPALQLPSLVLHSAEIEGNQMSPMAALEALLSSPAFRDAPRVPISVVPGHCSLPPLNCQPSAVPTSFLHAAAAPTPVCSQGMCTENPAADGGSAVHSVHVAGRQQSTDNGSLDLWAQQGQQQQPQGPSMVPTPQLPPPWYPSLQQDQQQQAQQQPAGSLTGLNERSMVPARRAAAQFEATTAPLMIPQPPSTGEELRAIRSLPVSTTTTKEPPAPVKKSGRPKRPKSRGWGARKRRGPAKKAPQKAGGTDASTTGANPSSSTVAGAKPFEGEPLLVAASHATRPSDCLTPACPASPGTAPAGGTCSDPVVTTTMHHAAPGFGAPARVPAGQEEGVLAAPAESQEEGAAEDGGLTGFPFMAGSLWEQAGGSLAGMLSPLQEALLQLPGPKGNPQASRGAFGFLSPPAASLLPLFSPTFCYGSLSSPFSSFRPQELQPLGLFGQQGSQAAAEEPRQQKQQQQQQAGTLQQEDVVQAQHVDKEQYEQQKQEEELGVGHPQGEQHDQLQQQQQQEEEGEEGEQHQQSSLEQGEAGGTAEARSAKAIDQSMPTPAQEPQLAREQVQLETREDAATTPASPAATLAPLLSPRSLVHAFEAVRKGSPPAVTEPVSAAASKPSGVSAGSGSGTGPALAAAGPGAEGQGQGSETPKEQQPVSGPPGCAAANAAKGSTHAGIRAVAATCPFNCPAVHVSSEQALCEVPATDTSGPAAAADGSGAKGGRKRAASSSRRARKKAPAGAAPTQESPVPLNLVESPAVEEEDKDAPAPKRQRKAGVEGAEEALAAQQAPTKALAPAPVGKQATQPQELQAPAQRSAPLRPRSTAWQQQKRVSKLQPQRSVAQRRQDFAALLDDEDQEQGGLPSRPPGAWPVPAAAAGRKKSHPLPDLAMPSPGQHRRRQQQPEPGPGTSQQLQQQEAPVPAPLPQQLLQAVADAPPQALHPTGSVSPASEANAANTIGHEGTEPERKATGPEPGADLLMALSSPQPPPLAALSMELQASRAAAHRLDAVAASKGKGKAARAAGKRGSMQPGLHDEAEPGCAAPASLAAVASAPAKPPRSKRVVAPMAKAAPALATAADPPLPPSKRQRCSPNQPDPTPAGPALTLAVSNKPTSRTKVRDDIGQAAAAAAGGGAAEGEAVDPTADITSRAQAKQPKSAIEAAAGPGKASGAQPRRSGPGRHRAPSNAVAAAAAGSSAHVAMPAAAAKASKTEPEEQLFERAHQALAAAAAQQVPAASGRRAAAVAAAAAIAADAAQDGEGAVAGSAKGRKRKASGSASCQAQGSRPEGGISEQPAGAVPSAGKCPPKFSAPRKRVEGQLTRMERSVCQIIAHVGTRTEVFESEIRRAFGNNPDISKALRLLREDERLVREGEGGRGTPFSYTATDKGRAEILACRQKLEADVAAMSRLFANYSPSAAAAAAAAAVGGGSPMELQTSQPGQGQQERQHKQQAKPSAAATAGGDTGDASRQPATKKRVSREQQQQQEQPKKPQRNKLSPKAASREGRDGVAGSTARTETGVALDPPGEPVTKDDNKEYSNSADLAARQVNAGSHHSDTPAPRKAPGRRKPVKKGGRGVGNELPGGDEQAAASGPLGELPLSQSPPGHGKEGVAGDGARQLSRSLVSAAVAAAVAENTAGSAFAAALANEGQG